MSAARPSWPTPPSTRRGSPRPGPAPTRARSWPRCTLPIFEGGGDHPGNPFIIGSGGDALLCRYKAGRRRLDARDQLTLESAGVFRHYHACLMRTLLVGEVAARQRALHAACAEALAACEAKLQPGTSMGEVLDAHAPAFDGHGLGAHRLNACGYLARRGLIGPSWMDWPMFSSRQPGRALGPDMVFFLHMILMDSEAGLGDDPGRAPRPITERGAEPLSRAPLDLIVR